MTCAQGKVEAELNLVTNEEKELNPVGIGRKEPEPLPAPKYVTPSHYVVCFCERNYFSAFPRVTLLLVLVTSEFRHIS